MTDLEFLKYTSGIGKYNYLYIKEDIIYHFENGRETNQTPAMNELIKSMDSFSEKNRVYFVLQNNRYTNVKINGDGFVLIIGPLSLDKNLVYNFTENLSHPYNNQNFPCFSITTIIKTVVFISEFLGTKQNEVSIYGFNFTKKDDSLETASLTDNNIIKMLAEGVTHKSFDQVSRLEECVKNGILEMTFDVYSENLTIFNGVDIEDIKLIRAFTISGLTIITRAAIKGGVNFELAYQLSDTYMIKILEASTKEELDRIYYQCINQFTKLSYDFKNNNQKHEESYYVLHAKTYITEKISTNITVIDIAEHLDISPNYLSAIFKNDTGTTITSYISSVKITLAKKMLNYSGYSLADIASSLGYASQSHFGKKFKEVTGMTPKEYVAHIYLDEKNEFKMIRHN